MEHPANSLCVDDLFRRPGPQDFGDINPGKYLGDSSELQFLEEGWLSVEVLGRRRRLPLGHFTSQAGVPASMEVDAIQSFLYLALSNEFDMDDDHSNHQIG